MSDEKKKKPISTIDPKRLEGLRIKSSPSSKILTKSLRESQKTEHSLNFSREVKIDPTAKNPKEE